MNQPLRHIAIWALIIALTGWFVSAISAILLPFILGSFMAYLLDPLVDKMEARNMHRGLATGFVTIISFSLIVFLLVAALPLISEQLVRLLQVLPVQLQTLYQQHAPELKEFFETLPGQQPSFEQALTDFSGVTGNVIQNLLGTLFASGAAMLNVVSLLLITPVVAFYLLRDWDHITAYIDELLPRKHAPVIREQLQKMDDTISGFLRGQMLVCSMLATFYVIGLTIMGLNFSVVIGLAAGFLIIIPYAGWALAAGIGMVIAFVQFDSQATIAIIAGIFIFGQVVEGNFVTPKLVGDRVGLHPVWIIFGMLAGGLLLGFVGVLLAIPLSAVIGVLIRFAILRYRESGLYLDGSNTPKQTP